MANHSQTGSQNGATSDPPPAPNGEVTRALVGKLKQKIFSSRPIFGRIVQKHGEKSLYEYSKEFFNINKDLNLAQRRPICLHIIYETLKQRLGKKIASEVERQLLHWPLVNTTDHHAIIDHPFWINTNVITALPYAEMKKRYLKYLVVFSFASVSLNNASGFPRGLLLHGGEHGEGELIRLPLLPDKWKMRTVYGTPAYTKDDVAHVRKQLMQKQKEGLIGAARASEFDERVLKMLEQDSMLQSADFCEQITKINYQLWPQYFEGNSIPDLIYVEAETMTCEILTKEVLKDPSCLLYKMLFDPTVRDIFMKYFEGLPGTFSRADGWGTAFFWAYDEKFHRLGLTVQDGKLTAKDKPYSIELNPEALIEALNKKELMPSMMTVYLVLSLHYGFKCLGGFSQVHDLTKMKEAMLHVLVELGKFREVHSVCRIQTKELSGDGLVVAYTQNKEQQYIPATGIDMLLKKDKLSYADYIEVSKNVQFEEIIGPLLPEMYEVLYPSYTREGAPEESLKPEKIMQDTGLQTKMETLIKSIEAKKNGVAATAETFAADAMDRAHAGTKISEPTSHGATIAEGLAGAAQHAGATLPEMKVGEWAD